MNFLWQFKRIIRKYNTSCTMRSAVYIPEQQPSTNVTPRPYIDSRAKPDPKYTLVSECIYGFHKHPEASYVTWTSKRSGAEKKGVYKVAYKKGTQEYRATNSYDDESIVREVFIANIFVTLLGKQRAAKGKFSFNEFGLISRVLAANTQNLRNYVFYDTPAVPLSIEAVDSLLRTVCLSVLLGNRDINGSNLILVKEDGQSKFVYSIDHEYCLYYSSGKDKSNLINFFSKIAKDPLKFIYMIFDARCRWIPANSAFDIDANDKQVVGRLFNSHNTVTGEKIFGVLDDLIKRIQTNDYELIMQVFAKIMSDLPDDLNAEKKAFISKWLESYIVVLKSLMADIVEVIAPYLPRKDIDVRYQPQELTIF
jgi:hypothetical protein